MKADRAALEVAMWRWWKTTGIVDHLATANNWRLACVNGIKPVLPAKVEVYIVAKWRVVIVEER